MWSLLTDQWLTKLTFALTCPPMDPGNCNYILFTNLPRPEDRERTFRSLSKAAICQPHKVEASHCPFHCWTPRRRTVNTNFYSLWFDPTENRTRAYRISSRRSFHSTTNRFTVIPRTCIGFILHLGNSLIHKCEPGALLLFKHTIAKHPFFDSVRKLFVRLATTTGRLLGPNAK